MLFFSSMNFSLSFFQQAQRDDLGKVPEGFVLGFHGIPLAKMKNTSYLAHHQVATGNLLQVRLILVDLFFAEKVFCLFFLAFSSLNSFLQQRLTIFSILSRGA